MIDGDGEFNEMIIVDIAVSKPTTGEVRRGRKGKVPRIYSIVAE